MFFEEGKLTCSRPNMHDITGDYNLTRNSRAARIAPTNKKVRQTMYKLEQVCDWAGSVGGWVRGDSPGRLSGTVILDFCELFVGPISLLVQC